MLKCRKHINQLRNITSCDYDFFFHSFVGREEKRLETCALEVANTHLVISTTLEQFIACDSAFRSHRCFIAGN